MGEVGIGVLEVITETMGRAIEKSGQPQERKQGV